MRQKRFKTHGSRWAAEGRVHRMLYSRENRAWYLDCRDISRELPHGEVVDEDTPITCLICDPSPDNPTRKDVHAND